MKLTQNQSQRLTLSVAQKLSVQLLQMDGEELEAYLQRESEQNPAVRLEWSCGPGPGAQAVVGEERDPFAGVCARGPGLYDRLMLQLAASAAPAQQKKDAVALAAFLDGNGYLAGLPDSLFTEGERAGRLRAALSLLQSLEPAGVGARDLRECLLLQLARRGGCTALERRIVEEELGPLAQGRFEAAARRLGVPMLELRAAWRAIRALDPKPGAAFEPGEPAALALPDVEVRSEGEQLVLAVTAAERYHVAVEEPYRELQRTSPDEEVRRYLGDQVARAALLCRCLQRRNETLLRVAGRIAVHQREFFVGKERRLSPLRLAQVAEELGLHETTVGRAVRGKYLGCHHGVYPMRQFFTSAVGEGEAQSSSQDLKRRLALLLRSEDAARPYSDAALCALLGGEEAVSRRTVAKYRAALGYPAAAARRREALCGA